MSAPVPLLSVDELEEHWMTFYMNKGYQGQVLADKVADGVARTLARRAGGYFLCSAFLRHALLMVGFLGPSPGAPVPVPTTPSLTFQSLPATPLQPSANIRSSVPVGFWLLYF